MEAYTNYISSFKKLYMACNGKKPKTDGDCLKFLSAMGPKLRQHSIDTNSPCVFQQFALDALLHTFWYYKKDINHYFLDKGVADFLATSVKDFTADYFVQESFGIKSGLTGGLNCFFIHIPTKEWLSSIGVLTCPMVDNPVNGHTEKYLYYATDTQNIHFESINFERQQGRDSLLESKYAADDDSIKMAKIVFGLSLYIAAFPDVVREVDGVMHIGHYKGHRHSVRANDIVRTEAHHSVSPHFRRGHFRLLSSEKFKHKRWQTIFIKGMFVKGKAFDVLADSENGGAS